MESDRRMLGIAVGGVGSILVSAGLVGVRDTFALVNVALVLVLLVLLGAVIGGRIAGVVSALTAAVALEFFHTRPFNSLKINDAADIETTILFLVVGLAIGEIAVQANQIRAAVSGQRQELKRVQRIAQLAARGESIDDLVSAVAAELTATLRLTDCRFERPPFTSSLPRLEPNGSITGGDIARYTKEGFELPRAGLELRVVGHGRTVGRFVLTPTAGTGVSLDHRIVAASLADQLGAALDSRAA